MLRACIIFLLFMILMVVHFELFVVGLFFAYSLYVIFF